MDISNLMKKYSQTFKSYLSNAIKEHLFTLCSCLVAISGVAVSTILSFTYPEVTAGSISVSQFFFLYLVCTSILAIVCIIPGSCYVVLHWENTRIKRLPLILKLRLAVIEFYVPSVALTLIMVIVYIYNFSETNQILSVVILCSVVLSLYNFSWPIRRRIDRKKLSSSKNKLLIKNSLNRLCEGTLLPLVGSLPIIIVILEIILKKTWIVNIYAPGIENFLKFTLVSCLMFLPSLFINVFRNLKSIIWGFIAASLIMMIIIPKNLSPAYNWLSSNQIANYDGINFIVKNHLCESLELENWLIQKLGSGNCKILTPFKVINPIANGYKIKPNTGKLNEKIVYVKEKDIQLVIEKTHRDPVHENLDKITEIFSKLYNLDILVSLKNSKHEIIISEHGVSKKFEFKLGIIANKAMSLGSYLNITNDLINLEDSASLIDKNFSGTVFEALSHDKDDHFFRLLIARIEQSFRHGDPLTFNIEKILNLFSNIAQKDNYINNFSNLGYWRSVRFDGEHVVELSCKWGRIELLLLYFREQDLVIAVALKKHDFILSLKDKRIQNFIHAIMRDNEMKA